MKISQLLLTESVDDRIAFLAKQRKDALIKAAMKDDSFKDRKALEDGDAEAVVRMLSDKFDPTPQKKALQFLVARYIDGQFKIEDASKIKASIETFFKFASKLKNKDIMSYKSMNDFYDAIEPYENQEAPTSARQEKSLAKSDVKKIIDTPDFKVIIPKTEAASKFYGSGTKWCTAADKDCMFDNYARQGDLYIIIAGSGSNAKKYQMQYESESFMDARDQPISKSDIEYLSSFPQYKDFLNMMIDKHYGEHIKAAA